MSSCTRVACTISSLVHIPMTCYFHSMFRYSSSICFFLTWVITGRSSAYWLRRETKFKHLYIHNTPVGMASPKTPQEHHIIHLARFLHNTKLHTKQDLQVEINHNELNALLHYSMSSSTLDATCCTVWNYFQIYAYCTLYKDFTLVSLYSWF